MMDTRDRLLRNIMDNWNRHWDCKYFYLVEIHESKTFFNYIFSVWEKPLLSTQENPLRFRIYLFVESYVKTQKKKPLPVSFLQIRDVLYEIKKKFSRV